MIEGGKAEELEIQEGIVSQDGQEIVFEGEVPKWYGGLTHDNQLMDFSGKKKWGWAFFLGLFWFFFSISLILFLLGITNFILAFIWLVLSTLLTITIILLVSGSQTHPRKIQIERKGIRAFYRRTSSYLIPWASITFVPETFQSTYLIGFKMEKNKRAMDRHIAISEKCAIVLAGAMLRRKDFSEFANDATFEIWNIALPNSKVIVANKLLTDEELRFRKLRRRFLNNGIYTPVYVTEEEDMRNLKDYLKMPSYTIEDLKKIGMLGINQFLWKESSEIWTHVHSIAPKDIDTMNNLAITLIRTKRIKEGLEITYKILRQEPNSSMAMFLQSLAYYEQGNIEEAQLKLGKAVEANPNNIDALQLWFDIVASEGGLGQAISEIDYLASTHKKSWGPYFVIGAAYQRMQKADDAYNYYKQALKREANETTLGASADVLIYMGKPNEAATMLEKHRDNLPPESPILFYLAHAWLIEGFKEKAQKLLQTLEKTKDVGLKRSIKQLREQYGIEES